MAADQTLDALKKKAAEQKAALNEANEAVAASRNASASSPGTGQAAMQVPGWSCTAASDGQQRTVLCTQVQQTSWWSVRDAMTISASVLGFGLIIILVAGWLIRRGRPEEAVLRVLGTILVVISALFLVVAGYDDKQISPVMGFLGTIAGYLLGKESKGDRPSSAAPAPASATTAAAVHQSTPPGG